LRCADEHAPEVPGEGRPANGVWYPSLVTLMSVVWRARRHRRRYLWRDARSIPTSGGSRNRRRPANRFAGAARRVTGPLQFDEELSRRVEAAYTTADVAEQRRVVRA